MDWTYFLKKFQAKTIFLRAKKRGNSFRIFIAVFWFSQRYQWFKSKSKRYSRYTKKSWIHNAKHLRLLKYFRIYDIMREKSSSRNHFIARKDFFLSIIRKFSPWFSTLDAETRTRNFWRNFKTWFPRKKYGSCFLKSSSRITKKEIRISFTKYFSSTKLWLKITLDLMLFFRQ